MKIKPIQRGKKELIDKRYDYKSVKLQHKRNKRKLQDEIDECDLKAYKQYYNI